MKLKEIDLTAMQAWSPAQQHPIYLATGEFWVAAAKLSACAWKTRYRCTVPLGHGKADTPRAFLVDTGEETPLQGSVDRIA